MKSYEIAPYKSSHSKVIDQKKAAYHKIGDLCRTNDISGKYVGLSATRADEIKRELGVSLLVTYERDFATHEMANRDPHPNIRYIRGDIFKTIEKDISILDLDTTNNLSLKLINKIDTLVKACTFADKSIIAVWTSVGHTISNEEYPDRAKELSRRISQLGFVLHESVSYYDTHAMRLEIFTKNLKGTFVMSSNISNELNQIEKDIIKSYVEKRLIQGISIGELQELIKHPRTGAFLTANMSGKIQENPVPVAQQKLKKPAGRINTAEACRLVISFLSNQHGQMARYSEIREYLEEQLDTEVTSNQMTYIRTKLIDGGRVETIGWARGSAWALKK